MENSDSLWRPLKKGKAVRRRRRRSSVFIGGPHLARGPWLWHMGSRPCTTWPREQSCTWTWRRNKHINNTAFSKHPAFPPVFVWAARAGKIGRSSSLARAHRQLAAPAVFFDLKPHQSESPRSVNIHTGSWPSLLLHFTLFESFRSPATYPLLAENLSRSFAPSPPFIYSVLHALGSKVKARGPDPAHDWIIYGSRDDMLVLKEAAVFHAPKLHPPQCNGIPRCQLLATPPPPKNG